MRINTMQKNGFTTIELLVYVAGMVVLMLAIGTLIYSMYNFYRDATIGPRVDRIGISVVDRITKDIRTGVSINTELSRFNVPTGAISMNAQSGASLLTKYFELIDGRVVYIENGGSTQYLTPDDISVSNFYLTPISTPISQAVKYNIDITYTSRGVETIKNFTGVAILRHSYE